MRLANGVPTDDQSCGFLIVHAHPAKGGADLLSGLENVGIACWTFGINVDQPHFRCGKRCIQIFSFSVAFGRQELGFGSPID